MTTLTLRDRHRALLFGICAGIARRTGTPPWVWRVALVVSVFAGMGIPAIAYLLAAWLAD